MTRKNASTAAAVRQIPIPHSWPLSQWNETASHVAPCTTKKARYLFRMHRKELLIAGAVARVGREIIFFGAQYEKFLKRGAARVPDYEIAANRVSAKSAA